MSCWLWCVLRSADRQTKESLARVAKPRRQHKHMSTEECAAALIFFQCSPSLSRFAMSRWVGLATAWEWEILGWTLDGRLLFAWSNLRNEMEKINFYIIEFRSNEQPRARHNKGGGLDRGRETRTLYPQCINSIINQTCTRTIWKLVVCSHQTTPPTPVSLFTPSISHGSFYKWISFQWLHINCMIIIIFWNTHSLWQSGVFFLMRQNWWAEARVADPIISYNSAQISG